MTKEMKMYLTHPTQIIVPIIRTSVHACRKPCTLRSLDCFKLKAHAKLSCCSVVIAYLQSISLAMYCKHKSSYPCTKVNVSRLKSLSAWNTAPSWSNVCRGTLVLSDNGSAVSMSLIKWRSVLQSWLLTSSITLQRIEYLSKCPLPSIASKEKQL